MHEVGNNDCLGKKTTAYNCAGCLMGNDPVNGAWGGNCQNGAKLQVIPTMARMVDAAPPNDKRARSIAISRKYHAKLQRIDAELAKLDAPAPKTNSKGPQPKTRGPPPKTSGPPPKTKGPKPKGRGPKAKL